ncbi:MAG: TolC family protein [Armatimonadota bacterium]
MKYLVLLASLVAVASAAWSQEAPVKLSLREALRQAVRGNPNITAAHRGEDAAKARLRQAEVAEKPTVQLVSKYSYLSRPTTFGPMTVFEEHTETNSVVVTKPLNTWGRTKAAKEQARRGVEASGQETRAAEDEVAAGTALAYLQALAARDSIRVAEQSVVSLERALEDARKLREAGAAAKADVLRTEVELARARENVVKARNAYQEALAALKNAIGLPQSAQIEVTEEGIELPVPTDHEPALRRSDIAALEAAVKAAEAGVELAKRSGKPQLGAYADLQNIATGAPFPRRNNTVTVMLQFSTTVSDGGVTRAKVEEAEAQLAQLRERLNAAKQKAEMEVRQARLQLDSAEARVAATATQVQAAEESLRVLEVGYREGVNTLTDVLSAQTALEAARYARVAALYDVQIAKIRLLRALGLTAELAQ